MLDMAGGALVFTSAELDPYLAAAVPLAYWRERVGQTQDWLAGERGVSQPFLARVEGGAREGSVGGVTRIARALGARLDDPVVD